MKLSPDDPKLTAYALGELDSSDAAEFERELPGDPELREAVSEIRETAALLKREFSQEPALSLRAKQKDAVLEERNQTREHPPSPRPSPPGEGDSTRDIQAHDNDVVDPMSGKEESLGVGTSESRQSSGVSTHSLSSGERAGVRAGDQLTGHGETEPSGETIIPFPRQRIFKLVGSAAIAASVALMATWQIVIVPQKTKKSQQTNSGSEYKYAQNSISQAQKKAVSEGEKALVEEIQSPAPIVNKTLPATVPQPLEKVAKKAARENLDLELGAASEAAPQQSTPGRKLSENGAYEIPRVSLAQVSGGQGGGGGGQGGDAIQTGVPAKEVRLYAATPQTPIERAANGEVFFPSFASASTRVPVDDLGSEVRPRISRYGLPLGEQSNEQGRYGGTARYPKYVENDFQPVLQNPLSTFSIDVDTASYANMRRFLNENRLPPPDAVRVEELINYFSYNYPQPKGDEPFSANIEVAGCPWNTAHRLVRIGLKGKEIAQDKRPPSNFVFLIDVSGSMSPAQRLPLIKQALRMLVKRMTENDRIAIVVYASSSGVVLESTSCANKEKILEALDRLEAGGSTNGGEGVQRAYALAEENFIKDGVNRVILCTDGDFNVGITDQSALINLIQEKAKSGVFLSALGVGTDNYKDALMQNLADKGNGNYHYIDTMEEAQKVLIQQMNGTLVTIAKDVKIQIEFNPAQVISYRLIGYEKRILAAEDFNNDKKDAGEIGAGHTVTALYEIVPVGAEGTESRGGVDALKYQSKPVEKPKLALTGDDKELLTLKLRYKKSDGNVSKLSEFPVRDDRGKFTQASADFRFASAVAGFGMILKNSGHKGDATIQSVLALAEQSKGDDKEGYRAEFINLVKKAKSLNSGER